MIDPKLYFAEKKRTDSNLFKEWETLEEYYDKKLWHQLTVALQEFIKNDYFHQQGRLIELYEKCIVEFENRINLLTLARIAIEISKDYKDSEKKIQFLEKIKEKASSNKEAKALMIIVLAQNYLNNKDLNKAKELADEAEEILDRFEGISPVHSDLYRFYSDYYYLQTDYVKYYKETLKFLGVTDLKELSDEEKEKFAYNLSIASLLGEDIYNFVELLSHPVFDALRGKLPYKWLVDLLYAFNCGNLKEMEKLKPQWSQLQLLKEHSPLLENKIKLLCLMELTYQKAANNRQLSFDEISKGAEIPKDKVEMLVMKALSLNLVQGFVDEIEQKVFMKWVQPRVLDLQQVATMNAMLEKWADEICGSEMAFHENAKEIIHY